MKLTNSLVCSGVVFLLASSAGASEALERKVERLEALVARLSQRLESLEKKLSANTGRSPAGRSASKSPASTGKVHPLFAEKSDQPPLVLQPRLLSRKLEKKADKSFMWFDLNYKAVGLTKPATAFEGVLVFSDKPGGPGVELDEVVTRDVKPQGSFTVHGVGFEFKNNWKRDRWMLKADLKDIYVRFAVRTIVYQDGTTKAY